jgi:hypothetical protein
VAAGGGGADRAAFEAFLALAYSDTAARAMAAALLDLGNDDDDDDNDDDEDEEGGFAEEEKGEKEAPDDEPNAGEGTNRSLALAETMTADDGSSEVRRSRGGARLQGKDWVERVGGTTTFW